MVLGNATGCVMGVFATTLNAILLRDAEKVGFARWVERSKDLLMSKMAGDQHLERCIDLQGRKLIGLEVSLPEFLQAIIALQMPCALAHAHVAYLSCFAEIRQFIALELAASKPGLRDARP